nr:unnamed protein product [Callosobruchus chinensis]
MDISYTCKAAKCHWEYRVPPSVTHFEYRRNLISSGVALSALLAGALGCDRCCGWIGFFYTYIVAAKLVLCAFLRTTCLKFCKVQYARSSGSNYGEAKPGKYAIFDTLADPSEPTTITFISAQKASFFWTW